MTRNCQITFVAIVLRCDHTIHIRMNLKLKSVCVCVCVCILLTFCVSFNIQSTMHVMLGKNTKHKIKSKFLTYYLFPLETRNYAHAIWKRGQRGWLIRRLKRLESKPPLPSRSSVNLRSVSVTWNFNGEISCILKCNTHTHTQTTHHTEKERRRKE